jgi:F0F1-type ATP synthase assembly protein I
MKKTVLTFGLISGLVVSILMGGSLLIADRIGSDHSLVLGYAIMVASFLFIYFGIRSYRDDVLLGRISFGRAFACGILITLVSTVCYVVMWEILYFNFMPHFMDSYFAAEIQKVQSAGLDSATTAAQVAAIRHSQQLYQNPLVNMAYTFMEPLPVGLIITLISATLLRRKAPTAGSASADPAPA